MSWFLSWLPGLPSIDFALPSTIQRRFVSFALKKSLERILKPGQLEVHQVNSQIESGYVQLKDLELDSEAITSMLIGLPIQLHGGSISAVTARISPPNPLTSIIGLSIQSLHLIFHLIPIISEPMNSSVTTLAEPVASAAKSFIHDELTAREETTLRESFHPDLTSSFHDYIHNMPGSMDPFGHDTDEDEIHPEVDSIGMLIFATLIKRLLANSELDAFDTKITITYPAHASFTFSVAEIRYRIHGPIGGASENGQKVEEQTSGTSRKISISGLTVSARDLRPPLPSRILLTPSPASSVSPNRSPGFPACPLSPHRSPSTPATSSLPLDEDSVIIISQSLANLQLQLAPEAPLPSSSITNDMSKSTPSNFAEHDVTNRRDYSNVTPSPVEHNPPDTNLGKFTSDDECEDTARECDFEPEDEVILSYCAEPMVIGLAKQPASYDRPPPETNKSAGAKNVRYTFSAGVLAFAFRAWHIRSVLDMLDVCSSYHVTAVSDPSGEQSSTPSFTDTLFALGLDALMKIQGIVILLLPSANLVEPCSLDSFFAHPLVPPRLPHGCVRIFLDGLSTSCSLSKSTPTLSAVLQTHPRQAGITRTSMTNIVTINFTLDDLSAFALLASRTSASHGMEISALPIVITDQNLPTQYSATHIHPGITVREKHDYPPLSNFAIMDWMVETHHINPTEISTWRTTIQTEPSKSQERIGVPSFPAIDLHGRFVWATTEEGLAIGCGLDDHVEIDVVPLHIFVDLGLVLGDNVLVFLNEVASHRRNAAETSRTNDEDSEHDNGNVTISVPQERSTTEPDIQKQGVDCLASNALDFGLEEDPAKKAGSERSMSSSQGPQVEKFQRLRLWQRLITTVNLSMIRFQFRCPPPSQTPRSGAVILDLHDVKASVGGSLEKRPAADLHSSSPPLASPASDFPRKNAPLTAECRRLVIATSLLGQEMANIVLSLGSLSEDEDTAYPIPCDTTSSSSVSTSSAHLFPLQILINRSAPPTRPSSSSSVVGTITVTIDSPSAHVDLPKSLLEGLQLWADDVSQLAEQTFSTIAWDIETKGESRFTSRMRSLFFAKSRCYGGKNGENGIGGTHPKARVETVLSIALSEVFVRLERPRDNEVSPRVRCFDTFASDVDILVEMKPDGKDETLITLGVIDLSVYDTSIAGAPEPFVSFTAHRSFSTTPKSIVQLQFIPQTITESDD